MATELATAYVALVPSLKGASQAIQSQIDGGGIGRAVGAAIGRNLGSSASSSAAPALRKAGDFFSATFGRAAAVGVKSVAGIGAAVAGVGTTIAGLAASGGMARALNLEQAQQMFKGMKLDWADYKDTVNAAVDGTAFSLDQAALVAANLAASGVAAGDEMAQALDACTGTAATFGRDLGDIGGLFQKTAAQGKLSGEIVQQFADRGVNVVSILSDALGKSGDEVKAMVSAGEVDFKTFSDAMYDAFGESASAANETFTGSMANMRSALSRIGEKFMTPIKDNAVPVFNAVRQALNQVNGALGPVQEKFAEVASEVGSRVVAGLEAFSSAMEGGATASEAVRVALEGAFGGDVVGKLTSIASVAAQVASAVGGLAALGPVLKVAASGVAAASRGFQAFKGVAGPVSSALSGMAGDAASFAKRFGGAGASAVREFSTAVGRGFAPRALVDKLDALPDAVSSVFGRAKWNAEQSVSGMRSSVAEKFAAVGEAVNAKLGGIPEKVGGALGGIKDKLGLAASMGTNAFKSKFKIGDAAEGEGSKLSAALGRIRGAAGKMGGVLVQAAGGLTAVAGGLMAAGLGAVVAGVDLEAASQQFMEKIALLTQNLPVVAQQFATLLPNLVTQLTAAMPALIQAFTTAFSTILQALPLILPQITEALTLMVTSLVPILVEMAPMLLDAGLQLFTAILQSLSQIMPVLIEQLPVLVTSVANVLIENLPLLLEAGLTLFMALVTAFIDMLPSLIERLPELIIQVGSKLASFMPQLLEAAKNLFMKICEAVPKILSSLLSALGELLSKLPGKVVSFAGRMGSAAFDMVKGMTQGIADAGKWVIDKINSLCSDALGAVKNFFGIASPSKLMRKMFRFVGDGMVLGLDDRAGDLTDAMKGAISGAYDVCEEFRPELNAPIPARAAKWAAPDGLAEGYEPGRPGRAPEQTFNIYSDDPELVAAMVARRQRRDW